MAPRVYAGQAPTGGRRTRLGASLRAGLSRSRHMLHFPPRQAQALLLHAVIWVLLGVLLFTQPTGNVPQATFYGLQTLLFGVLLGVFYLNVYWAVPRLLYGRRLVAYLGFLAAVVLGVVVPHRRLQQQLEARREQPGPDQFDPANSRNGPGLGPAPEPGRYPGPPGPPPRPPGDGQAPDGRGRQRWLDPAVLLSTLLVVGLGTSVAAVQRGQRDAQVRAALEQERLATELSLLKAQINPHFFFNTLNNIYALTLLDGERARAALHRLSRMMRYVLYETPGGQTHLSQEISFLRDYIDLMHLRLTDQVEVVLELPPAATEPGTVVADPLIAPMLFQPFVENAFKHGVSATAPSRITVALRQPGAQQVELCVRNTLFPAVATPDDEPGGIGLANTRRRLDLLYPGRYHLRVTSPTPLHEYEVCLSLQLLP